MTGRSITRADLSAAVCEQSNLSRSKASAMVDLVLKEIADTLVRGETVKLASFGVFIVRKKNPRMGRNPKTGEDVPISHRRVMVFKPSAILKQQMNGKRPAPKTLVAQQVGVSAPAG